MEKKAVEYLDILCIQTKDRCVGSSGNRAATDWFSETVRGFGFETEAQEFDCIDWDEAGADLTVSGHHFDVFPSYYSVGSDVAGPLALATTVDELRSLDTKDGILLLRGAIASEPLMPKAFVFYNPPEHKEIYRLLTEKAPKAIVTATARNPALAGGNYPYPMIEDGDFDIPSAYMTEDEGERLAEFLGSTATLRIRAERRPASGQNVVARMGRKRSRIVVCAHIDAKPGTPGATDNATGVATLLLLAERLSAYEGDHTIELVALNGEDYYSVPGQMLYLTKNEASMENIRLAVNVDGAGYKRGPTAWSLYGASDYLDKTIRKALAGAKGVVEGPPWYQGDHSMFVQAGQPALAFTSLYIQEHPEDLFSHTPKDHPREVEPKKLVELSQTIHRVILELPADA